MRLLGPSPVSGKVMSTVRAEGRRRYGSREVSAGSKRNGMVLSRPVVVVAAWAMWRRVRSGRRKVDVQPAPRIRRSTGGGGVGRSMVGKREGLRLESQ